MCVGYQLPLSVFFVPVILSRPGKFWAELATFSVVWKGGKGPDNAGRQGNGTPQGGKGGISARYQGSHLREEKESSYSRG